jgi:hypothetical protein
MNTSGLIAIAASVVFATACGGVTSLSPSGPSVGYNPVVVPSAEAPSPAPAAPVAAGGQFTGAVGQLEEGAEPCFADRFECDVYDFEKVEGGPIEVTLTWEGAPRALMVQLYWAGEGLAHEDVAPRTGPSAIHFRRPMMEAASYRIRVVNVEGEAVIPYTLTLAY